MYIGTWNVQGVSRKMNEVLYEMNQLKIDIAVLTETKKKGQGSENLGNYDHFYSGVPKENRAGQGVSILIHRKYRKHITMWEAINERMIKINLCIRGYRFAIIGIYAINEDALFINKDQFFQQLNNEVTKIGQARDVFLVGDFNSRTGRRANDDTVGKYGEDVLNNNGERLIDVCKQNALKILNGFYQHREIHKYTWTQETRGLKSIIDFIISKKQTKVKIYDVRVFRSAVCGSDHHLLRSKIILPYRENKMEDHHPINITEEADNRRYNLMSLEQESVQLLYQSRLNDKLQRSQFNNTEEHYQYIKECIHSAAYEALGLYQIRNKEKKPYWWDEEIEEDIKDKREKYQKYLTTKEIEDKIIFKEIQAKVRRKICQKKNDSWERNCTRLNTYIGGRRSTESWRLLRNIRKGRGKDIISPITPQQWEEYMRNLLTENRPEFLQISDTTHTNIGIVGSPIRLRTEEVRNACISLKNGKSPGAGNIPAELIKFGTQKLYEHLTKLFQHCLNGNNIPEEWNVAYLSTIHKKGDRNKCENYRGISVTCTISRIYGRILKNRIENEYQEQEAEEQAGFRAGRSTIDHLFSVTQIIEKQTAVNQEIHLVYIDLKKAYDNVPLIKLWEALNSTNINAELIKAIKSLYKDTKTKIKIGNKITEGFNGNKGLKQGCCLSPTLFKIYLEQALKKWKQKCRNMGLPLDNEMLYTLCFADDQVIIAQDYEDACYMTRKLIEEYQQWGLEVNMSKTEYMCIGGEQRNLILDNSREIKSCTEYKYLGLKISNEGTLDEAINERNMQGRKAITLLNGILWDRNISNTNKKRIYDTIVKSIITYSCEVWPLKEKTKRKLEVTEMDFWRRSAGKSRLERVTNERIREIMNVTHTIVDDIKSKQLIWYGHVHRMSETRLPKQITQWKPRGRRKRGRPRRSWQEGINKAMEERNLEDEMWNNREAWRAGIGRRRTF